MTEHHNIVPENLPVPALKLLLQVSAQLRAVLRGPPRNTVKLPSVPPARPRAGLHDAVLHVHQPFFRLALTPDSVVARQRKVRIQDLLIINNLIPVQNNALPQMLPRHIQRTDVVACRVVRVLNDLYAGLLLRTFARLFLRPLGLPLRSPLSLPFRGPLVELLLQVPHHHINLRDAVAPQAVHHRVDHPHAVNLHQRLRSRQRQRVHPVAKTRRHYDGPLHNMILFTHLLCLLAVSLPNDPLRFPSPSGLPRFPLASRIP